MLPFGMKRRGLLSDYRRFGGGCCLLCTAETPMNIYRTSWRHKPEDLRL